MSLRSGRIICSTRCCIIRDWLIGGLECYVVSRLLVGFHLNRHVAFKSEYAFPEFGSCGLRSDSRPGSRTFFNHSSGLRLSIYPVICLHDSALLSSTDIRDPSSLRSTPYSNVLDNFSTTQSATLPYHHLQLHHSSWQRRKTRPSLSSWLSAGLRTNLLQVSLNARSSSLRLTDSSLSRWFTTNYHIRRLT
jgi:hypothetical protein